MMFKLILLIPPDSYNIKRIVGQFHKNIQYKLYAPYEYEKWDEHGFLQKMYTYGDTICNRYDFIQKKLFESSEVELDFSNSKKYDDVAQYISEICSIKYPNLENNQRVWCFLSCRLFDTVCQKYGVHNPQRFSWFEYRNIFFCRYDCRIPWTGLRRIAYLCIVNMDKYDAIKCQPLVVNGEDTQLFTIGTYQLEVDNFKKIYLSSPDSYPY